MDYEYSNAASLGYEEWHRIHGFVRDTFQAELQGDRTPFEIDQLVGWYDPNRYVETHQDPNERVGNEYNDNQEYRDAHVVLARAGSDLVGYGSVANNVSGSSPNVMELKYASVLKRYAWIHEIVVHPDYRRKGLATEIGRRLLTGPSISRLQPVSTYIWPDVLPHLQDMLEPLGFTSTDEQMRQLFGEGTDSTVQLRMQAPSVHGVIKNMKKAR